ncbi:MAG: hypothetical protein K2O89_01825 [Clostridia bacterium]|nr:hypothetical protein [Clostridia bacterium]
MYKIKNRNKGVKISLIVAFVAVLVGCLIAFAGNPFSVADAESSETVAIVSEHSQTDEVSAQSAESLAEAWNAAVEESIATGKQVTFTLTEDWTLNSGISIPANADIILDLNGHTVNGKTGISVFINVLGTLELQDSTGGGKITGANSSAYGSAVSVYGTFIMNGGEISGNVSGGGSVATEHKDAEFIMNGGVIKNNRADGADNDGYGGGVIVYNGTFEMNGGEISENTADYEGGGVWSSLYSTFIMNGGKISNNNVIGNSGGGGVVSYGKFIMNGGEISGNTSPSIGGGVMVYSGSVVINNGEIYDNEATQGGGVHVYTNGTFEMSGGTISDNTATYGGGVYGYDSTFKMSGGEISGNTATTNGGGVYGYGTSTVGFTFNMTGGTITNNKSEGASGGVYCGSYSTFEMSGSATISSNTSTTFAAGVQVSNSTAIFTMSGGTISGNTATTYGGGVCVFSGSTFEMSGGEISGNKATTYSGGVYVHNGGTFEMNGGEISGNIASTNVGGGVYVNGSTFVMNGGAISDNTAGSFGGGVYALSGTFEMSGGAISDNTTTTNGGGGVYVIGGMFEMSGGEISGNTATTYGGGVYVLSNGTFEMSDGTISDNTATYGGGVHVVDRGTFEMSGGEISGNTATTNDGGGVYVSLGTFKMSGGEISGNTATTNGGGVYVVGVSSSTFILSGGGRICDNISNNVYLDGAVIKITGVLIGAKIGVTSSATVFTSGFGTFNNYTPALYFFADNGKDIVYSGTEAAFGSGSAPTRTLTWKYATSSSSSATYNTIPETGLTYTGTTYYVKAYEGSTVVGIGQHVYNDMSGNTLSKIKNAGTYSFTATSLGFTNPSYVLKISPVELSVTWEDTDLYYSGNMQYPKTTLSGVLGNDNVTLNLNTANAGTNAGNYSVTIAGLNGVSVNNYKLASGTVLTKTYTIHKAQLVKPVASGNLTYNGEEQTYSVGGYNSLLMSLGGTYAATNAGKYTATIEIKDTKNYEWADGTNTTLNFEWTINKLYVTVTGGIKADDKYYDGTTAATISATDDLEILGVLAKDLASLGVAIDPDAEQPAEFDSADAGWHTVIINGFILTGDAAKNYELTSDSWVSFAQIKPAELKISGYTVKDKTYDATCAAEFLKPLIVDGVGFDISAVNGAINKTDATAEWEKLIKSVIISGTFASANAGEKVAVSGIKFTYPVADSALWSNYVILVDESTEEVYGKIVARQVVVEINDTTATYGQSANLTYSYGTAKADGTEVDGILPQDDLKIKLERESGDGVGKYKISGAATNEALSGNYEILWVRVQEDGVKADLDEEDGSTKPVYEIVPASLVVKVNDMSVVYGSGVTLKASDLSFRGFVNGDGVADLNGELALDKDAEHYSGAGLKIYDFAEYDGEKFKYPDVGNDYSVLACGYSSDNYEITYEAGNLTVTPKKITVVIDEKKATFGALESDLPELSWELDAGSALLDGHEKSELGITLSREEGDKAYGYEQVGRYLISGATENGNYEINFRKNYYEITPFEIDLKWYETADDLETAGTQFAYEYNGKEQTPVAAFAGLADTETGIALTCTSIDEAPFITVNGSGVNAGSYKAQAFITDTVNFTFASGAVNEIEFTVTPKTVEVKWYANEGDTDSIILGNNADGSLAAYVYQLNRVYKPYATADFFEDGVSIFVAGGQTGISGATPHTATAYIVGSSNYAIKEGTGTCNFIIIKSAPDDLLWYYDGKTCTSGNLEVEYNGEAHAPVAVAAGCTFYYEIKDENGNIKGAAISAGEYTVIAIPKNENVQLTAEQKEFRFVIKPMAVDVNWSAGEFEYNGKVQKPEASFTDANGNTVTLSVVLGGTADGYGVTVGTYAAQTKLADGVKNYVLNGADENGVIEYEFEITAKSITVTWDFGDGEFTYNGEAYNDGVVKPELDNPVDGEEPELAFVITKDGVEVDEIKDAGVYTLSTRLASGVGVNKNYAIVNGDFEFVITKADLKITASSQTVKTGTPAAAFTAEFDGFVGDDTAISVGAASEEILNDDGTGSGVFKVSFLTSGYSVSGAYTQEGFDIVLTDDLTELKEILKNYNFEELFVKGHITLTVNYGDIRVTANLEYDGEEHRVQAWYFNGNDGDDPADDDYWQPLGVEFYTDSTYSTLLTDENGAPVTAVKEVGKYYIRLEGLPEGIDAEVKRVFEIAVRTVVVHIKDLNPTYGSLTADNLESILENSWEWDGDPLRRPAAGDDLGITLNLYKQLVLVSEADFDAAGYLCIWANGDYFIKGSWNSEEFGDMYQVIFDGSMTDDGVNGWGVCRVEKATIIFSAETDEDGYSQRIEDLTIAAAVDKKNSAGEYVYITLQGNENALVTVSYGQKYSLDLGDKDLIPEPEEEQSWSTVRPTFELTAAEIAAGLEKADRHYVINFKIEAANHEIYYGQWRVEVLGSTVCVKIVFTDKQLETVYGGTFGNGSAVPEGRELAAYLYANGYIDTSLTTVSAADWAKLSAKVVAETGIATLGVGEYDVVFEGAENIVDGKYVLTYKKQLSDVDATNAGRYVVSPQTLEVDWGETELTYNGEKQLILPVIKGWSCNEDYAVDGVYSFTNDKTGETLQIKVTLSGDFIKVGGHGFELEILENDNYTFRSGETVKTTKGVLSITGEIGGGKTVVNEGMPAWLVWLLVAVAVLAIIVIAVLIAKRRKHDIGDDDGFYEDADMES